MAKKQKAKEKADIKDESIDPQETLEEDDLLVNIIANSGLLNSKSEARRMIKQSAVKIDGETVTDIHHKVKTSDSFILKVGKRKFLKVSG